ncbi:MAG: hypothetical protein MR908_10320 [Firmicutes bacterium]|nr:hypothetical protein [Bacillota bacterium]
MNKKVAPITICLLSIIVIIGIALSVIFTVKGYSFALMPISLSLLLVVMLSIVADVVAQIKIQRAKIVMAMFAVIGVLISYLSIG